MQPRELILRHGPGILSDAALLQVLIGAGNRHYNGATIAAGILAVYPALQGLNQVSTEALMRIPGLGLSKASVLMAGIEFGGRVQRRQALRYGQILDVQTVGEQMVARLAGAKEEYLLVILMDVKNAIIQEVELAHGGIDKSVADPRVVFRTALAVNASKLILVHNHPSGDPAPSQMDIDLTNRFVEAGAFIGVEVLDHLIVGQTRFYSFSRARHI